MSKTYIYRMFHWKILMTNSLKYSKVRIKDYGLGLRDKQLKIINYSVKLALKISFGGLETPCINV